MALCIHEVSNYFDLRVKLIAKLFYYFFDFVSSKGVYFENINPNFLS